MVGTTIDSAMLTSYSRILQRPGTARFCGTGLVARLPISMIGLGIVLLVQHETGSYGLAGAVSAAHLVANAVSAVVQGRLIDRLGQHRVLPLAITVWGVALTGLMWSVETGQPLALSYALAALAGLGFPAVGSCVRARWAYVLTDSSERQTAFALESVVDEAVFITGPILVTALATTVHPVAGLAAALVAGVIGTLAFSAQRSTEPPAHPRQLDVVRPAMPWRTVAPLTVVCLALGVLFGAAEVTTVAFADEQGSQAYAGVLLALWAAGSLTAGVVTGALSWRAPLEVRLRIGAGAMALAMLPLTLVDSVWVMGAVLLVAGLAIAPTLIASIAMAEQSVSPSRLTEGMAYLQTGIVAGVAPGAALAGIVIDAHGASAAYLVPVAGGLLALVAAFATPATVQQVITDALPRRSTAS